MRTRASFGVEIKNNLRTSSGWEFRKNGGQKHKKTRKYAGHFKHMYQQHTVNNSMYNVDVHVQVVYMCKVYVVHEIYKNVHVSMSTYTYLWNKKTLKIKNKNFQIRTKWGWKIMKN